MTRMGQRDDDAKRRIRDEKEVNYEGFWIKWQRDPGAILTIRLVDNTGGKGGRRLRERKDEKKKTDFSYKF